MNPEIWRHIFDALEEPAFLHDAHYRLTLVNRAYCRVAGVAEAQVRGRPYWEVFPLGSGPLPSCLAAASGQGDTASEDEVSVGAKLFLSKGYTVRDQQNQYLYSLHLLSDVTAAKQAVAQLAASEERLRQVVETARDAIITVDGEGGVIRAWNPAAEAMFGYSRQQMIGRPLHDFLPPVRFRETAIQALAHFAASGQGGAIDKTLELVALHQDGTEFPIELSLSATQMHGQWQATGIVRDISARKRSERALLESEQRHRSLVAAVAEGVVLQDATAAIVMCNEHAAGMLGLGMEQLMGARSIDPRWRAVHEDGSRFPGETHPAMYTLRTGVPQFDVVMGVQKPDGVLTWISINTQPLIKAGQALPDGVVSSFRDISERKQTETRLAEQLAELRQWQAATLGREARILDLKHEVNELLAQSGLPARYPSAELQDQTEE
jgi:PAS domain S-box-containing protein